MIAQIERHQLRKEQQLSKARQLLNDNGNCNNDDVRSSSTIALQSSPSRPLTSRHVIQMQNERLKHRVIQSNSGHNDSNGHTRHSPMRLVSLPQALPSPSSSPSSVVSSPSRHSSQTLQKQHLNSPKSLNEFHRQTSQSQHNLPSPLSSTSSSTAAPSSPIATSSAVPSATPSAVPSTVPSTVPSEIPSAVPSVATSSAPEPKISPEILFLIKEQAKAIAKINSLQKKVDMLEMSLNANSNASLNVSQSSTKTIGKDRNVTSDDSGGEYSRATISDDDELSSLLDQIAKCSQKLNQKNLKPNQSPSLRHTLLAQRGYSLPVASRIPQMSFQQRKMSQPKDYGTVISQPKDYGTVKSQPLSALLFEPNVERVLHNLDEIIDDSKPSSSNILSRSLPQNNHPLFNDLMTGVASPLTTNSNWQLERVRTMIKQREQQEFASQMRLADQWLVNHLDYDHGDHPQRLSNFMDSLEPSTFR